MALSQSGDELGPESLQDWPAFCEGLRAVWARTGQASQRELEKRASRKGLSLPRSTVSRMLNGTNRPSKVLVANFLRTVGVDDRAREEWKGAWDRVAYATSSSRDSTVRSDLADDASVEQYSSEDVIYEVAADVVDIVRAVATRIRDDVLRDLTQVVSDARAAFAEIDNLLQSARDATAQAKQSATEIVKRALREAEDIKKNAKSTDSMSIPSLLDIPAPTGFSPSNSVPMLGATSLSPTYNLKSGSPSVEKPQVVDASQVTARPPVGTSEKKRRCRIRRVRRISGH